MSAPTADRLDQDLHRAGPAQAETRFTDLQKAGTAPLENAQAAADLNTHFRHATHPTSLAADFRHVGPFAGSKHFQRQEIVVHDYPGVYESISI
jgi:hypothetical protein